MTRSYLVCTLYSVMYVHVMYCGTRKIDEYMNINKENTAVHHNDTHVNHKSFSCINITSRSNHVFYKQDNVYSLGLAIIWHVKLWRLLSVS